MTDEFLAANEQFVQTFDRGGLQAYPERHIAILTCMDTRLPPLTMLGLDIGDAHVIRNAGGRASDDAIRSLIISSQLLGTNQFFVIHHTDCGMKKSTNDEIRRRVQEASNTTSCPIDFLAFSDEDQSVRDDMHQIRQSPYIPSGVTVRGFVYDVRTGRLREISS